MLIKKLPKNKHIKDLIGQKFGKLTVQSFSCLNINSASKWNCICECGGIKEILGYSLTRGHSKSCGCLIGIKGEASSHWKGYGDISSSYFNIIKKRAESKNFSININIEYIWDLFLKQNKKCAISGIELNFQSKTSEFDGTASLDRIHSNKGYIVGNCQWVHKDVNYLKNNMSDKQLVDWCCKIADYQRSVAN